MSSDEQVWPNGTRLAVNFVLNVEEGAELSTRYGDERRENTSEAMYELPLTEREMMQESIFDFGARVGNPRVAYLFRSFAVPLTVFAAGRAMANQSKTVRALADAGSDFCGHGYRWEGHAGMTEEEERISIRRAIEEIEKYTGTRPRGWFTRPLSSEHTRRILAEEGLQYDCDSMADELPYRVDADGRDHLVVPYALDVNDTRFWKNQLFTGSDFFDYAKDAIDFLLWESAQLARPRMLSIGLHGRIIGRPARARALRDLLQYVTDLPDVWLCRRNDLVDHWIEVLEPSMKA
jgi:peptidoglycan/xylan/chitin deacetylase (PgdA/CDA1 family)